MSKSTVPGPSTKIVIRALASVSFGRSVAVTLLQVGEMTLNRAWASVVQDAARHSADDTDDAVWRAALEWAESVLEDGQPQRARELGNAARRASRKYRPEPIARQLTDLYCEVLETAKARRKGWRRVSHR